MKPPDEAPPPDNDGPEPRASGRLRAWLETRVGTRGLLDMLLREPVPGGARWWYVFGSVTTFLLALQVLTGVVLAAFYAPATATAWASVAFIQDEVTLGWFVRGLHSFGASGMIVVTGLHLGQVLLYGAYKAPREVNWIVGVLMLGLVLAFALTGYLLPWDQKGYWATQVATSMVGAVPLVGEPLQRLLQGGSAYGNATLSRFFALHALVLPGAIAALLAAHLYLFRRHGVTPKWGVPETELAKRTQTFWPDQMLRDLIACCVAFLIIALLTVRSHGAGLEAPADPASTYVARPEWYFLPLFQLLRYFEGPLEIVGALILPGLVAGLLLALPFIDRAPTRDPRRRLFVLGGALVGLMALLSLGLVAVAKDDADPAYKRHRADARQRAERARRLARSGVPPEGGLAVFRNDPFYAARELWDAKCEGCHSLDGRGGERAPDLLGYNSRPWIRSFLENPNSPLRMGPAKLEQGMKPVQGSPQELEALTELVYAQTGADDVRHDLVERGRQLFSEKDCDTCHELDGETPSTGPNLRARGTVEYVTDVINNPGAPRLYGKRNKMPAFAGKLSPEEIVELAKFVVAHKDGAPQ